MNAVIEKVDPFLLPRWKIEDKTKFPRVHAIYFVISGDEILYIGRAMDLRSRWSRHHKLTEFIAYEDAMVAWIEANSLSKYELNSMECFYINYFHPRLNGIGGLPMSCKTNEDWHAAVDISFKLKSLYS